MPRTLCISVTVGFFLLACDLHNRPETDPAELFERGVDLFEDRSYQQAETSLNQALEQFEKQKNGSQAARVLGYIGQIKLTQGQYRAALDRLQSAIDHSRSANDYRAESQMNMYLGDVFLEMGEAVTASERYQGAHSYYTAFNDKKASADVELRMARAAQRAGEWERALQLYERAYNYYGSSNDPAAKAEALDGMGEIYASQGRHPEALNSFTQALTALGSSGNTVLEARLKLHAGLSQSAMGNPNAALEQLREAANALRSKRVARELESLILFRIGTIYYYSGRSADAKRYYTEASSVARAVGDKIADNYNALLIARCDESMVQTEELEKTIEPLLQSYKSIAEAFNASGHRTGEAYAWAQAGRLHGVLGNLDRAHELYSKAVELDESIVGEYRHQELHQPYGAELGMEKERDRWYNALAEIMLREKKPAESLRYLERNSAKRFRDRFFDVPVEIRHTQLQQDVQRTREKLRQLRRLETEWSRWLSVDPQAASEDQLRALQLEIGRSKEEIAQTAERIARIQPNYELLVRVGEITLAGVQSAIPRGTLVLRFLPAPDQFYIFALTRSRFEVRTSAIKADELLRMVDEYQRLMQDPNVYAGAAGVASVPSMTRFATLSTQLYNALLKPIDDLYERNLLIMPGREFETFPFHTIERQDQKGNVQYVVEFMSVDYLPCFAALTYKTAMSLRTKDVIALGNPTGKNWSVDYELRDIRSFYKAATIRIGLEASWQGLTGARGDVLQISSEFGSGRVSKPLGTFVLSGGETQGESVELPFEKLSEVPVFPVVYLSNQLGEGSGLAAAHALLLRIAGTADLFLNSWSADRKAAKFFSEYFYTHLANGLAPGDAYRQTLLNMIRTKEVNHPRSWGQFFHYGTG